jgi:hypothetical protein
MTKRIGLSLRGRTRRPLTVEWLEDRRLLTGLTFQPAPQFPAALGAGSSPPTTPLVKSTNPNTPAILATPNSSGVSNLQPVDPGTSGYSGLVALSNGIRLGADPGTSGADQFAINNQMAAGANLNSTTDNSNLSYSSNLAATPFQAAIPLEPVAFTISLDGGQSAGITLPGDEGHPSLPVSRPGPGLNHPEKGLQEEFLLLAEWATHDPLKAMALTAGADLPISGPSSEGTDHRVWLSGNEPWSGEKDYVSLRAAEGQSENRWVRVWTGEESEAAAFPGATGPELAFDSPGDLSGQTAAPSDQLLSLSPEWSAALALGIRQFLNQVENLGQDLGGMLEQMGCTPWLMALAATAISTEVVQRRLRRRSPRLNLAGGGADETLTWVAGLPGPFRSEES